MSPLAGVSPPVLDRVQLRSIKTGQECARIPAGHDTRHHNGQWRAATTDRWAACLADVS
jgi:hypothetical protein